MSPQHGNKRRQEFLGEIQEHIDSTLAEPTLDAAEVRNVLDRLGDPADIAEEARQRFTKADW